MARAHHIRLIFGLHGDIRERELPGFSFISDYIAREKRGNSAFFDRKSLKTERKNAPATAAAAFCPANG